MGQDGHELNFPNLPFDKVGNRYGIHNIVTYKDCFYEFRKMFNNPTDVHVKFLEIFAQGFPFFMIP